MGSAFVIGREEVARWGDYRLVRDHMRENRRRGEPDRGDWTRWWVVLEPPGRSVAAALTVSRMEADQIRRGVGTARPAVEGALEEQRRAAQAGEAEG